MTRDCRGNLAEGWSYLISYYLPMIRRLLAHYYPGRDQALLAGVMKRLHDPTLPLYGADAPITDREWVAALRLQVIDGVEGTDAPASDLDLETLTAAFEEFTATERQFLWLSTMAYSLEETALMMNLEASTIGKARERAEEALRGKLDSWKRGLLTTNGHGLCNLARAARGEKCLLSKAYIDMLDGRITWAQKRDYEFHMVRCWHCVDVCCRIRESDHVVKVSKPLTPEEAAPFRAQLGLPEVKPKKGFFKFLS